MNISDMIGQSSSADIVLEVMAAGDDDPYTVSHDYSLKVSAGDAQAREIVGNNTFGTNSHYQGIFREEQLVKAQLERALMYASQCRQRGIPVKINGEDIEVAQQRLKNLETEYAERRKTL